MDLLWMILPVFLACTKAKNLTEVRVKLGQNATLNCSMDSENIFWYMEIHSHFKGCIAHSFSKGRDRKYYVNTTITKYVVIQTNRLMITNITAEDYRLYFCSKRQNSSINVEEEFRISSVTLPEVKALDDVSIHPSTNEPQQMLRKWPESVIYISLALNALLLLVIVIGLVFTFLCVKRKSSDHRANDPSRLTQNQQTPEAPQYEEIQHALPPANPPPECVYYKAQLPRPTTGQSLKT